MTASEERELHALYTAHRLGRVSVRDMPASAPLLTRLATSGRLRQIASGMYRINEDGRERLARLAGAACGTCIRNFASGQLRQLDDVVRTCLGHDAPAARPVPIECTLESSGGGELHVVEPLSLPPGRYRARLERAS